MGKDNDTPRINRILTFKFMIFLVLIPLLAFEAAFLYSKLPKSNKKTGFEITNLTTKFNNYMFKTDSSGKEIKKETIVSDTNNKRVFFTEFKGDTTATEVKNIKEVINMIIINHKDKDEAVINIESPGGSVTGYGYLASEISRLKEAKIPTTIVVDEVAASGGYMAASVGDKIIAAPFAMVGSIGVVAQVPIFADLMHKVGVDYKTYTAGLNKRNVTPFKIPTEAEEERMNMFLTDIHVAFKDHVHKNRPNIKNIDEIADGSVYLAAKAKDLGLVDEIGTKDDYLLKKYKDGYTIYQIQYYTEEEKEGSLISTSINDFTTQLVDKFYNKLKSENSLSNIQ